MPPSPRTKHVKRATVAVEGVAATVVGGAVGVEAAVVEAVVEAVGGVEDDTWLLYMRSYVGCNIRCRMSLDLGQ